MTFPVPSVLSKDEMIPVIANEVDVALVVSRVGRVDVDVVVAVKYEETSCPTTDSGAYGEVVPIPTLPRKYDEAVVVASKLPTVSCVPVAIRLPDEFVVTIELIGSVARDVRGTFETVRAPDDRVSPLPVRLLNDEPFNMRLVVEAVRKDE